MTDELMKNVLTFFFFHFSFPLISKRWIIIHIFGWWWYLFFIAGKSQFINRFSSRVLFQSFDSCASVTKTNAIIGFVNRHYKSRNAFGLICLKYILHKIHPRNPSFSMDWMKNTKKSDELDEMPMWMSKNSLVPGQ